MWKFIGVGAVALAIASASFLYAEQASVVYAEPAADPDGGQLWESSPEDLHEFAEARLAALKSALVLTSAQALNWAAFEQAARQYHKLQMDRRMAARNVLPSDDPVERLHQRARAMSDAAAALQELAEATEPLYRSLEENQKLRLAMLGPLPGLHSNQSRGTSAQSARTRTEGDPAQTERPYLERH